MIIASLIALAAAIAVVFYKGFDKIKEFDFRDPFDLEDDDNDLQ